MPRGVDALVWLLQSDAAALLMGEPQGLERHGAWDLPLGGIASDAAVPWDAAERVSELFGAPLGSSTPFLSRATLQEVDGWAAVRPSAMRGEEGPLR